VRGLSYPDITSFDLLGRLGPDLTNYLLGQLNFMRLKKSIFYQALMACLADLRMLLFKSAISNRPKRFFFPTVIYIQCNINSTKEIFSNIILYSITISQNKTVEVKILSYQIKISF
jgi:hypothetical protein